MIKSGPTSPHSNFIAKVEELITEKNKELSALDDNAKRTTYLLQALATQNVPLSPASVPVVINILRQNKFTDHTQPLIELIEENREILNTFEQNSARVLFLTYELSQRSNLKFHELIILGVLKNEGFTDKAQQQVSQVHLFTYALMVFSAYAIFSSLQKNPGHYTRNLTVDLTTRTCSASIGQENRKLMTVFSIMLVFVNLSVMFGFMPSLGSLFNHLPEELDPKTYGDKYVSNLAENFGNTAYYALVPLVMMMQTYGPSTVVSLFKKMFDNPLFSAAHEFCTLARGGDEADELLQQHPEIADTIAVRGITWGFDSRQSREEPPSSAAAAETTVLHHVLHHNTLC